MKNIDDFEIDGLRVYEKCTGKPLGEFRRVDMEIARKLYEKSKPPFTVYCWWLKINIDGVRNYILVFPLKGYNQGNRSLIGFFWRKGQLSLKFLYINIYLF